MKPFILVILILLPFLSSAKSGSIFFDKKQTVNPSEFLYNKAKKYFYENNYDSSSFFLFKIISTTDSKNTLNIKSHILLGYIFSNTEKFELSDKYLKIALKNTSDSITKSQIYGNLGDLNFKKGDLILALTYFKKSLAIVTKTNSIDYQILLSNIGATYIELKKPEKALPYIQKANDIALSMQDTLGQSICINNLATIYRDLNQQDSALFYYHKALNMVDELGSKEEKKIILFNLSGLHEKKGNTKLAFNYYKQYVSIKQELFDEEKHEFIVETQEKYQATKRLKDLAEMKVKAQQKEARDKQFMFFLTLISIAIGLIFIAILAWQRWKAFQQRSKSRIAIITATMQGEEKQRLKISQEIHDDLGGLLGVCRMLFTKSKQFFTSQNKELFERIDSLLIQANNRSRAISHELFSPTLKQFGLESAIQEQIANLKTLNPDLEINFFMQDFRLDEELELNCFRITQELFTNTIKYANASSITLRLELESNKLNYTYQDNGIGFDPASIKKGVGLNSIEARVKSFHGKIHYPNTEKGFEIRMTFQLPKTN